MRDETDKRAICPLSIAAGEERPCEGPRCAWWARCSSFADPIHIDPEEGAVGWNYEEEDGKDKR